MRMTTPVAKAPVPSIPPSWPLGNIHLYTVFVVVIEEAAPAMAHALETDVHGRIKDDGDGRHSHTLR
jgi:hypothetical protein